MPGDVVQRPAVQVPQQHLSPFGRLLEACLALVECDTDDDQAYALAEARCRTSGANYARHLHVGAANACAACGRGTAEAPGAAAPAIAAEPEN